MLYTTILGEFEKGIAEIQQTKEAFKEEIKAARDLCNETLDRMKRAVHEFGFVERAAEINFFREIKVVPMQYLVYYSEVRSTLLHLGKNGLGGQLGFLESEQRRIQDFLGMYTEFIVYMEEGWKGMDKQYFTRKYFGQIPTVSKNPYYNDKDFCTARSEVLSMIQGYKRYENFLNKEKLMVRLKEDKGDLLEAVTKLQFTDSTICLSELVYALETAKVFNDGKATIDDIAYVFEIVFDVKLNRIYRNYTEMKGREDQTAFLNRLIRLLQKRMDDDDAK